MKDHKNICVYCGSEVLLRYEGCYGYYECDCEDAKKARKIEKEIYKLKISKPRPKYYIENKQVLVVRK